MNEVTLQENTTLDFTRTRTVALKMRMTLAIIVAEGQRPWAVHLLGKLACKVTDPSILKL